MSYASGLMMGTAIIQGISQLMGGMASAGGMGGRAGGMGFGMGGKKGRSQGWEGFPFPGKEEATFERQGAAVPWEKQFILVSSLPGRRRYRIAGMTEGQASMFEQSIGKLSYMKEVRANPVSGSLLLVYDEAMEEQMDEIAALLEKQVLGEVRKVPAGDGAIPAWYAFPSESHAGEVTRTIRSTVRTLSSWIKEQTNGCFDASSLASVLLFFQGLRKMLLNQEFPSGSQMFWWAVSLMRGWRTI